MRPLRLTKAMLVRLEVLNQVDHKFIACVLPASADSSIAQSLLLVDQHAAHERVLLEQLEDAVWASTALGRRQIRSAAAPLGTEVELGSAEAQLLGTHRDGALRLGLDCHPRARAAGGATTLMMRVRRLPEALAGCDRRILELYAREAAEQLGHTRGLPGTSIPAIIHRVLKSRACRNAIMFGDPLTKDQCRMLISQLAQCRNPFQCAHGRPSTVPILSL